MKRALPTLVAYVAGLLFGVGLAISGMTRPSKVIGFLDFTSPSWDPSLAFVMAGALVVTGIAFRLVLKRQRPLLAGAFSLSDKKTIDARLLVGAAVFGVGWGLGGICPGPALVILAGVGRNTLVFGASMVAGMLLFDALARPRAESAPISAQVRPTDG